MGHFKVRALRLDTGNFAWATEGVSSRARILDVVYNATSNELVRTKTLVKNAIVTIDAAPFKHWYAKHYDVENDNKKKNHGKAQVQKMGKAGKKKAEGKKFDIH